MSSMDAESSESFPGNSDKSVDHSHGDPQTVGFSHGTFWVFLRNKFNSFFLKISLEMVQRFVK